MSMLESSVRFVPPCCFTHARSRVVMHVKHLIVLKGRVVIKVPFGNVRVGAHALEILQNFLHSIRRYMKCTDATQIFVHKVVQGLT